MDSTNRTTYQYDTLKIKTENGVATVILNNEAVNVLSGKMMKDLHQSMEMLAKDKNVKVIVFESENPDFFIAHVDINILEEQETLDELGKAAPAGLNMFQAIGELLRNQPQVTIVKLQGIARGGGAEFVAASDMSFAAVEKGKLSQCESLMGIIPGGGATQYLTEKTTRGRALEIILGAELFDAATAERYGWINRAIADAEIDEFVWRLAHNIAALPEGVIGVAKEVLTPKTNAAGFKAEHEGWAKPAFTPKVAEIMKWTMANGGQTVAGELEIEALLRRIPQYASAK